jgi:hypothetical protein
MHSTVKVLSAFVILASISPLRAEVGTTAPSATSEPTAIATPADATALRAKITSISGMVQVRTEEGQDWQRATVGMELNAGAELRTGLRSAVQFVIEPDQVITLDRLGTLKVLQAYQQRNKVTTDLGVKYGRTRYDIEAPDLEHQSTIRSPGSTLAIRGTDVTYEDQAPWVPSAVIQHGRAQFRNFKNQYVPFGGKKQATISADKASPAQSAAARTKVDPRSAFAGRTGDEDNLLLTLPTLGGIDAQGLQAVQALAKIGGFKGNFAGAAPVPGPLEIDLFWMSTLATPNPTNLDLLVTDPKNQTASALNPTIGKGSSIGMHSGDDMGAIGSGVESVIWSLFFPKGTYTIQAINRSGDNAQFFILVNQGQTSTTIKSVGVDPQPAVFLAPGQSFTTTVKTQQHPVAQASAAIRTASPAIKKR